MNGAGVPAGTSGAHAAGDRRLHRFGTAWACTWPLAMIIPLLGWKVAPPILRSTRGFDSMPFELFAVCVVAFGVLVAAREAKVHGSLDASLLPIALALAVLTLHVSFLAEYAAPSGDYQAYEAAAQAVQWGGDPYAATGGRYRYPPLLAQALERVAWALTTLSGGRVREPHRWAAVFFLYETLQLLLVLAAFLLGYRVARRLGVAPVVAASAMALLLACGNPVVRTLHYNQPNFWLLDLVLLGTLTLERVPWLAGTAIAVATHLKIYPAVIGVAWVAAGRWRAVFFTVSAAAGVLLIQTRLGTSWELWVAFVAFAQHFPAGAEFRDNSLHSVTSNAVALTIGSVDGSGAEIVTVVWAALSVVAGVWTVQRFRARRRHPSPEAFRLTIADASDALAFALLASPMTWEHHFVLAIPLALVALSSVELRQSFRFGAAVVLVFFLPTFDLFPLSYHRLAGLVWLMVLTQPRPSGRTAV